MSRTADSTALANVTERAPGPANEPIRTARQADTIDRLCVAAEDEVAAVGYDHLTVRNVARRAGVAPATAYTYFSSKEHLITEVFWRRLTQTSPTVLDPHARRSERVAATLRDLSLLVADAPELAAACTVAMLADSAEVKSVRDRIGAEWRRRLIKSLGESADPLYLATLEFLISGALVHAGTDHLNYGELPSKLAAMAHLICGDAVASGDTGTPSAVLTELDIDHLDETEF